MTDLTLITGFLGSGKTSLLQQLLANENRKRYIVLVNEFSSVDVDGERVEQAAQQHGHDDRVTAIPGGSIFCKCLVTTFIEQLQRAADLADEASQAGEPFDSILIEASGMADPSVTTQLLEDTRLNQRLNLKHIIAMVDPATFGKLLVTLPNVKSQIKAASLIVINKSDRHDAEALERVTMQVRKLNPTAALVRTQYGRGVDTMLETPGAWPADVSGELAACRDPNYAVENLEAHQLQTLGCVSNLLRERATTLYRAKGTLTASDGRRHVIDLAGDDFQAVDLQPAEARLTEGRIVLITSGQVVSQETSGLALRVL